jgi:uncharacterized protein YggE
MEKDNIKKLLGIILSLFLLALIISTALDIQIKFTETENTISVSATGEVWAKPDLALINLTVVNEAKTVAEALSENTERMNKVISFIEEQGIEEKDIKTTSFNIYPRYEWHKDTEIYPEGERVLVGYEVIQNLQVKIIDMAKIGEIIQGATDAGANQIGDLQFTIDDQDEFKKQAREQAIEKAKTKAKELASQLGVKLIRISNFTESSVLPSFYVLEKAEALGMGGEAPAPQIETGENKIEVTVSITYEIK